MVESLQYAARPFRTNIDTIIHPLIYGCQSTLGGQTTLEKNIFFAFDHFTYASQPEDDGTKRTHRRIDDEFTCRFSSRSHREQIKNIKMIHLVIKLNSWGFESVYDFGEEPGDPHTRRGIA